MDAGRKQADKTIFKLHKMVAAEYTRSTDALVKPLTKHLRKHEKKRQWYLAEQRAGRMTREKCRKAILDDMLDEDFLLLLDDEAERMEKTTGYIWKKIKEAMPEVYAEGYNWGVYRAEQETKHYIADLLTAEIVKRMWKANPDLIKTPGKQKTTLEKMWQKEVMRTAFTAIVTAPFPIDQIVKQVIDWIRRRNISAGKEYATTTTTGTENKGKIDGAQSDELMRGWVAIMDERTRIAHRILDGTYVGLEEPWVYKGDKVWFPGDPTAPAYLVRNCRCTVDFRMKSEIDGSVHKNERFMGQSYEEWKAGKPVRVK